MILGYYLEYRNYNTALEVVMTAYECIWEGDSYGSQGLGHKTKTEKHALWANGPSQ